MEPKPAGALSPQDDHLMSQGDKLELQGCSVAETERTRVNVFQERRPSSSPRVDARRSLSRLPLQKVRPDHIKNDVCEACVWIRFAIVIDQLQQLWNKQRRLR